MRRASRASAGLPKICLSIATVVSAARTTSWGAIVTAAAFSTARRST